LASLYPIASLLDLCLRWCDGCYFAPDTVNSMSPGFQVFVSAGSVGP
jgi:hypothetical protein